METVTLSINSADNIQAFFKNRTKLTGATVKANKSVNASELFSGCLYLANADVEVKNADDVSYMFYNNRSLKSENLMLSMEKAKNASYLFYRGRLSKMINLPDSIENLNYAFYDCTAMEDTVTLPKNLIYMDYTFYRCYKIYGDIALPEKIKSMQYTFYQCGNISNVSGNSV